MEQTFKLVGSHSITDNGSNKRSMKTTELKEIMSPNKADIQGHGIVEFYTPEQVVEILRLWKKTKKLNNCKVSLKNKVSNSIAIQYAEFCVRCDREKLPLLCLEDYIKQYCC
jgi:hypothetical protein